MYQRQLATDRSNDDRSSLFRNLRVSECLLSLKVVNYVHPWWRHEMESFSALRALCSGNSSVTGEFPTQRPVTRSFDVSFDMRLNKRLSKQSWGWWFETPPCSLWRHRNAPVAFLDPYIINFTVGVWSLISVRHWLYVSLICMHHFVKIRIRIYNIACKDYKYHYQSNTFPNTDDIGKHKTEKIQQKL